MLGCACLQLILQLCVILSLWPGCHIRSVQISDSGCIYKNQTLSILFIVSNFEILPKKAVI